MLWERDAGLCGFCRHPVDPQEMDVDHIVPLADGGPDEFWNLRVAHRLCNRGAGARQARARRHHSTEKSGVSNGKTILFSVRLPADIREALYERARADGRSVNSEIVHLLRQSGLTG
jgi:hypothetical protein